MTVTKDQILEQLRRVKGPDLDGNIVDLGLVSDIHLKDGRVAFSITVPAARANDLEPMRQAAEKIVSDLAGVAGASVVLTADRPSGTRPPESARVRDARTRGAAPPPSSTPGPAGRQSARSTMVPGIRHMIAVASGKGGVGKSTTAVNLALGLQAIGLRAGILDADIYGPSQPRLLGLTGRPEVLKGTTLKPMEGHGLKAMSMGFLVDEGTPIIWRGPMVVSALTQMLRDVAWGELDVLVIDMPPGTGDVQLTIAQQVPLSGAVIVSTPQDLALIDARKGLNMFRKVDVPVLGIIENMSTFICPKCGTQTDIFGHGGARAEAEKLGVPFLGAIPLHIDIRARSDAGQPIVASEPQSVHAQVYRDIAAAVWAQVGQSAGGRMKPPQLEITNAGAGLAVAFEGGPSFVLPAEMLRVMSPSAEVQGHSPEQRVTVGRKKHVKIKELRPVGNYAVRIAFDDGHDTGLFSWTYLQQLWSEREERWTQYLRELGDKGMSRE